MKRVLALGLLLAWPAWAAAPAPKEFGPQEPKPGIDPHVCTVPYRTDRATHIHAAVDDNVTLQFGEGETIKEGGVVVLSGEELAAEGKDGKMVVVSTSGAMALRRSTVGNLLILKAPKAVPLQPITVRMMRQDGPAHIYLIEFETGDRGCLLIRWTYAEEEAAAKRAAQAAAWRSQRSRAAEAALATPAPAPVNRHYSLVGDPRLIPQVTK